MAEQYVRQYAAFRGVDFSSDPSDVADYRVTFAQNMWRDYQNGNGDMIETITGYRAIARGLTSVWSEDGSTLKKSNEIYGVHQYRAVINGATKDYLIVHVGRSLFFKDIRDDSSNFTKMESGREYTVGVNSYRVTDTFMLPRKSTSVMVNNKLIIIDGANITTVYPNADKNKSDYASTELTASVTFQEKFPPSAIGEGRIPYAFYSKPYEPTVYKDGEPYEQQNMLSDYGNESFTNSDMSATYIEVNEGDGTITYYTSAIKDVYTVYIDGVEQDGSYGDQNRAYYIFSEDTGKLVIQGIKVKDGDNFKSIDATADNMRTRHISAYGTLKTLDFLRADTFPTFTTANENIPARDAITGCTSIAVFNGKIFLTGNPKLPNTVFFSQSDITGNNNPTYFGIYNWFNTGVGMTRNVAMTTSQSVLMVYKGDTVQDGSIYYVTPFVPSFSESDDLAWMQHLMPISYSATEGAAGIGCIGGAFNFMDDPVFITRRGLDAVGKQMTNLERSIIHRSSNVDKHLLGENLANARMAQWQGYLVIAIDGNLYLADSRAMYTDDMGNAQYEWFYVEGVGSYDIEKTSHRYRYWQGDIDALKEKYGEYVGDRDGDGDGNQKDEWSVNHDKADKICDATNIAWDSFEVGDDTVRQYYSIEVEAYKDSLDVLHEETKKYLLYEDEEVIPNDGAEFRPLKEMRVIDDVLYFATDGGDVFCFNTDKRGEIPDSIFRDGEWVDNNYSSAKEFVGVIPQEYYTFDGRRYVSGVITKTDNAGIPYATKNTIKNSLVIRCGADPRTHSSTVVEVLTDRNSSFNEVDRKDTSMHTDASMDFSSSTFNTYPFAFLTYREKERKWIEKKYKIYNDAYKGILRIHSLSYRYEIGGKIK